MHGLTVSNIPLHVALSPVARTLDRCWWYLGGAGMQFPWIRPPLQLPPEPSAPKRRRRGPGRHSFQSADVGPIRFDPVDWERYLGESRAAAEEYARWLDDTVDYRVGKPGFFSRYAAGMESDWQLYIGSDSDVLRPTSFDEVVSRFKFRWFEAPPDDLPPDICIITRDVDNAYLDLFFRDEPVFQSVWNFLDAKGMKLRPYRPMDFKEPHGKRRRRHRE